MSDSVDPLDQIRPFLGKAKELPAQAQEVLRHVFVTAKVVEGAGEPGSRPCPVCGQPVKNSYVAVQVPGRRAELVPLQISHMVLSHDFWHPSLQVIVSGPPALVDHKGSASEESAPGEEELLTNEDIDRYFLGDGESEASDRLDSDAEVVERRPARKNGVLPFSDVDESVFEQVPIDVTSIGRAREPEEAPDRTNRPDGERRQEARREVAKGPPRPPGRHRQSVPMKPDPVADDIWKAYGVPRELAAGIAAVARSVGASPFDLANLVHFESGFRPDAVGPVPGAVGLLQFPPWVATALGTSGDSLRKMSAVQQLVYVGRHLDGVRRGRPLDTSRKLYMAVFYPDAVDWPGDRSFPDIIVQRNTYEVDGQIVSIQTPDDYGRRVELRAKLPPSTPTPPAASSSPVAGVFSWFSDLFSGLRGEAEPESGGPAPSSATWVSSAGVVAHLVDASGQRWGPGRVPAGRYRMFIAGHPAVEIEVEAGRSYRASGIGRMISEVVDGG